VVSGPLSEPNVQPIPDLPRGYVGTIATIPYADHVDVRLATSSRLPFRVDGAEQGLTVTVYGAETRTNIMLYGAADPLIDRMEWEQVTDDLYRLHVGLNAPLWGHQSFFDEEGRLVVRIRRPPPIDPRAPLRGLYIGVDAGHPPGGAIGPTRLTEAEATLGVSRRLARLLEDRGARVLQTRPDTAAVGLGSRPLRATQEGVHLLVSVHFDAFGDGVNPFENHGTHVFYNQEQSLDFAREVHRELLAELRLRDLGVSRRDLALVRPTWMPSILSESAFMMVPQNEAALRDPRVLDRIAEAHLRGIESFLRARAAAGSN
jgi:N-acetylmuramoyl-L-alanine amidase